MKQYVTTLAITIRADSVEDRDFLAATVAEEISPKRFFVQVGEKITARVERAQVKRSRPVRRAK